MPRAQLLVASNCTCYQHLEDNLHRSSADSCDVGFSRWECWEPFLISVTNVGIGLRWFSAGPLYGAVLMAQSAALNFILVRDAQCARHHIARSDQNDTEWYHVQKTDPDPVRVVRCILAKGSLLHQGRRQSNHWQGKSSFKTQAVLTGRVLLDWCSSLVRPEPLITQMGMLHANCAMSKLEFPGRTALHASHGRCAAEPWPQLLMLHVLHPMGCIPGASRYAMFYTGVFFGLRMPRTEETFI